MVPGYLKTEQLITACRDYSELDNPISDVLSGLIPCLVNTDACRQLQGFAVICFWGET